MFYKYLQIYKNKINIAGLLLLLPAVVVLFLLVNRLFYAAELTDEAYYLAMSKSFIDGMRPFHTSWDSTQTSALFMVPFLYIYKLFTNSTEGIFLYARIIFFGLNILVATVGFFAIKKYTGKIVAVYIMLILVTYAPFSIYTVSYNNLAYTFLLLGIFLFLNAYPDIFDVLKKKHSRLELPDINTTVLAKKNKKVLLFLSGTAHAFMAFFYPHLIILCVFFCIFVIPFYIFHNRKNILYLCSFYIFGGISTALILFSIIFFMAGGISNIISGMNGILLNSLYGQVISTSFLSSLPDYIIGVVNRQNLMSFIILGFPICYLIKTLINLYPNYKYCFLLPILLFIYTLYHNFTATFPDMNTYTQIDFTFLAGGFLPLILFTLLNNKKNAIKLLAVLWLPGFIGFLIISNSSGGTYLQAPWVMAGGLITTALLVIMVINELTVFSKKLPVQVICIFICILLCSCNLFIFYNVIYRDEKLEHLTSTVEYGIYKGLKTTEQRKDYLENTEKLIKNYDRAGHTVMMMENAPFAYLFSDMRPSSPNLWTPTWYILGIPDCTQIFEYFSNEERIPDFVYLFYPSSFSYGNDPNYDLHLWIQSNYTLIYDNSNAVNIIPFYMYERLNE